jgi:hypothetical protein
LQCHRPISRVGGLVTYERSEITSVRTGVALARDIKTVYRRLVALTGRAQANIARDIVLVRIDAVREVAITRRLITIGRDLVALSARLITVGAGLISI